MWPLLIFSVITLTVILERIVFFIRTDWRISQVKKSKKRCPAADVFLAGEKNLPEKRDSAMETEAAHQLKLLEQGFSHLSIIASLSPIVGFLGTVSGMIGAFAAIANAADVNVKLVAGEIFEALITTAFGLIVSLAASIGLYILRMRTEHWAADLEYFGSKTLPENNNENCSQTNAK